MVNRKKMKRPHSADCVSPESHLTPLTGLCWLFLPGSCMALLERTNTPVLREAVMNVRNFGSDIDLHENFNSEILSQVDTKWM